MKNLDLIPRYVMQSIRESYGFQDEFGDEVVGDRKAFLWFWEDYNRVQCHPFEVRRTPSETDRIADYIDGLPPTFDIVQYINQRKEQLIEWGWTEDEAEEDKYNFSHIVGECISVMHKFFYCDDE